MRQIKFRGKRKGKGGEWLVGDLNHIDGKVYIFPRTEDAPLNSPDWFEVIPESVGQFTGLLDKNGLEVYKGDLVSNDLVFGVVVFDSGCFCIEVVKLNHKDAGYDKGSCPALHEFISNEVVGNNTYSPELVNKYK